MEQPTYVYWGKVLRVNLGQGSWSIDEPGDAVYRRYIGGRSLALYYFLRETADGLDPLGPPKRQVEP